MDMKRIASNSRECAEAIGNLETFTTYGALRGEARLAEEVERGNRFSVWDSGRLYGVDEERFRSDLPNITYVVFSYATPIAWVANGEVYRAVGRWSVTTSKHQGKLYLLKDEVTS